MSNESGAAEKLTAQPGEETTEEQVVDFLRTNPNFFLDNQSLLTELSLPHESGKAVSLLERQVSILRERNYDAHAKLGSMLENAHVNDQLFANIRSLLLNLIYAEDVVNIVENTRQNLMQQSNIDACEIILESSRLATCPDSVRCTAQLKEKFPDVFRLAHTYCGRLSDEVITDLFGSSDLEIRSTALCPICVKGEVVGLLALGNEKNDYFNANLDTMFLDFIGDVVGILITRTS